MTRRPDTDAPPEAPASRDEARQATAFGRLLGPLLDGAPLPPALDSDQRALLEAAGQVVASTRVLELDDASRRRVVDDALERALAVRSRPSTSGAVSESRGRVPRRRLERLRGALPWTVAATAAAAAVLLLVTRPTPTPAPAAAGRVLEIDQRSRPADGLIGRIPRDRVDDARHRLDAIYADRMAGYRSLRLGAHR